MKFRPTFFILFLLTLCAGAHAAYSQTDLRNSIAGLTKPVDAKVGVGVIHLESGDTLTINGNSHFPMQSVFKFHLSLAVLNAVDNGKLSLDQQILIHKDDYFPNTWSPIAKKFPDGDVNLTIRELVSYSVASSDNIGCDILFRLAGGPKTVEAYIHNIGITDVAIVNTEREMHQVWDLQFKNWTTPRAMAKLLDMFYKGNVVSRESTEFLNEVMENTITGVKRIKGFLPEGTKVAHKTGMGGHSETGVLGAVNDVGVVTLPNGEHVAIALFITNTKESVVKLETLMAEISKKVFDYYTRGQIK